LNFLSMSGNIIELKHILINTSSLEEAKRDVESRGYCWEDWYYERARRPKSIVPNIRFWKACNTDRIEMVSVEQIVGNEHQKYDSCKGEEGEPRWITLLYNVSDRWRSDDSKSIINDIERENLGKSPVHLNRYGDQFFISEGLHRAVQAKFLKITTMRCLVTEFGFDSVSFDLYQRLASLIGETPLAHYKSFTGLQSISFEWLGISFRVAWNDECIRIFEREVNGARRIYSNPIRRVLLSIHEQFHPEQCLPVIIDSSNPESGIIPRIAHAMIQNKYPREF
jgi:hypothetical protein